MHATLKRLCRLNTLVSCWMITAIPEISADTIYIESHLIKPNSSRDINNKRLYLRFAFFCSVLIRSAILLWIVREYVLSREIAIGSSCILHLSMSRKVTIPSRTLNTFPMEGRRFRVPEIESIRNVPIYSGTTAFCCKRISFVCRNNPR